MFTGRYPAKTGNGPGPWLNVIREANGVCPGMFGAPNSVEPWWAGGEVENYDDALVIHRGDGSVSIVAQTQRGSEALTMADAIVSGE